MTPNEAREIATRGGYRIRYESRMRDGRGWQFRVSNGAVVNLSDKGTYQVQGDREGATEMLTLIELFYARRAARKATRYLTY